MTKKGERMKTDGMSQPRPEPKLYDGPVWADFSEEEWIAACQEACAIGRARIERDMPL